MYVPVAGARMSSDFGPRNSRGGRISSNHGGIDFAAPSGSIIRAVVPGVVIGASYAGTFGNLVKVRHEDGTIGYYAHMSRMQARVGQRVSRGTAIGRVGSTGRSTGPHVHFEVRRSGRSVNPAAWLSKNYPTTRDAKDVRSTFSGGRSVAGLSAEQMRSARTIISVGRSMGASQRDLIIALMTAYQESRLRNLNYGDRDSVGLFQQRAGWGSRSQRMNPAFSARMFFSGGVRGPGTEGLLDIGRRSRLSLTGAAQAVQRSAFPNAYAQWEGLARSILGGGVGQTSGAEILEEPFVEEEPLDGMVPRTPGGGFPLDSLLLPGVPRPMPGNFNPNATLDPTQVRDIRDEGPFNKSTNESGLREMLNG